MPARQNLPNLRFSFDFEQVGRSHRLHQFLINFGVEMPAELITSNMNVAREACARVLTDSGAISFATLRTAPAHTRVFV